MTRTNLKFILEAKELSVTKIATSLGVTTASVYDVLRGKMSSKRIEAVLEASLEMPIEEIRAVWKNTSIPKMTPEAIDFLKNIGAAV